MNAQVMADLEFYHRAYAVKIIVPKVDIVSY
jgi:hypothetical protein